MKPTEQLKEEHQAIKLALSILLKISERLDAGEKVSPDHMEKMLEFIKMFADRCHHGKEEDLLFLAMEEAGVPREGGPIAVMLMEHDMGRGYVRGMSEAADQYSAGEQSSSQFAENARNYVQLLTQHIDKEDNILYPIADMHLQEKRQRELIEEFEKVETERIGAGKHEEFHKMLHQLEEVYLH